MKKFLIFIIFVLLLVGIYYYFNKDKKEEIVMNTEIRSVFISYIDYSSKILNKNTSQKKDNIDIMIKNIYDFGLNTIILQVRPFADAIYKSDIFKPSKTVVKNEDIELDLDILSYFISEAHKKDIKVYAWINPYRIRTSKDTSDISKSSIFYSWLEDSNNIEISETGIYFNPASNEVLELILEGVKEIVLNYDVDGILYDDYFYPNKSIDEDNYNKYKATGGELTIEEYRVFNINTLIESSYKAIKSIKKDVIFGISPAGNIENNLNNEYLDIKSILNEDEYLDFVIPQLYYGFLNEAKPYIETLKIWNNMILSNTKLVVGLSIYKSGLEDTFAGIGSEEWINSEDIIKKQVIVSRNESKYDGFAVFRYDHLFNNNLNNENLIKEQENLLDLLR